MGRSILLGVGGAPRADPGEGRGALPRAGGCGSVAAGSAPDSRGCLGKVLPCLWALGAGCGAARRPLAGLWMGLVPAAPLRCGEPAAGRAARSGCLREPRCLSYGRQEGFREGGSSTGKGRQGSGEGG